MAGLYEFVLTPMSHGTKVFCTGKGPFVRTIL